MPSVAPIVVAQTGQFHLTDYNFARSSVLGLPYIPGASLPNGTRWLVFASGTGAGEYNGIQVPGQLEMELMQGYPSQKTYGFVKTRSNLHGTPESHRAGQFFTAFVLNSNGTDLEFKFYTVDGSFDAYLSGFKIVAYPMADMVQGVDYFYEETAGDGLDAFAPILTTTSSTYSTALSKTYNVATPGQYLVLGSCGMNCIQSQSGKIRLVESGVPLGAEYIKAASPVVPSSDRYIANFMAVRTLTPAPGNITYEIQGASNSGGSDKRFYQPRITVIRLEYFEAFNVEFNIGGLITQNIPSWMVTRQNTFVPPVDDDYVLVLGNTTHYPNIQGFCANRIRNSTAATVVDEGQATANFFDANIDRPTISTLACELVTSPTNYVLDATGEFAIGNTTVSNGTMVVLGLTPRFSGGLLPSLTVTETLNITDSVEGMIPVINQAETLQISDSVTFVVGGGPVSIPVAHPRLLSAAKLAKLQANIGSAFWNDMINNDMGDSDYSHWMRAVAYKVGGDVTHLNWIKNNLDTICNYHVGGWESGGLSGGRWVRSAALIYDLCYNELTGAERKKLQDFILGSVYALLHDNFHPAFEDIYNQDWSRNDPANNYFAGMHQAAVYCALVLYHDVFGPALPNPTFNWPPGTGSNLTQWIMPLKKPPHTDPSHDTGPRTPGQPPLFTDGLEYVKARFEQIIMAFWDRESAAGIVGGGWHEGSWYRPMWAIYDCFKIMQEVSGYVPPIQNIDFRDFIYYCIHTPMPGATRPPELGDSGAASTRKSVGASERTLMLQLAETYRDETAGQYARWWLLNVVPTMPDQGDHQWDGYDFYYDDPTITAVDYRPSTPKFWYSAGNGLLMSRTGWTSTDTCVSLHSQDRIQLHEHAEQNSIQIACGRGGTGDSQFIVGPRCAHGSSGENQNESHAAWNHSTYKLAGHNQRASGTENFGVPDPLPTGNIDRHSGDSVFVYGQGNASDAYRLGSGFSKTWPPNKKTVDVFLRDFVHTPAPNLLVTYDRVKLRATTPAGDPVTQTIESYLHYTSATVPTHSGGITTAQAGTARVFKKPIFPVGQAVTLTNENGEGGLTYGCYEEHSNLTVTAGYARHLQVFDITDTSQAAMVPTTAITSSDFYEGVSIDDGGVRYHFLFSLSQTGAAPPDSFYYDVVKLNANDRHIVCNLDPGFAFYHVVESDLGAGVFRYSFTRGGVGLIVDVGGCVSFTPATLTEGPTVIGTETAIAITDASVSISDFQVSQEAAAITLGQPEEQTINEFMLSSEATIMLSEILSFGDQVNLELTELAIVVGPEEETFTGNLGYSESPIILDTEQRVYVDHVDSTESSISLGAESLTAFDVIAPLSTTLTIGAESMQVTVIAPPPEIDPPGGGGERIDTSVSFEGDIDTQVDF